MRPLMFVMNRSVRVAFCVGCLVGSNLAQAAWIADGKVRVDSMYNDNVTLSSDNKADTFENTARGELELRQVTENSEISVIGGANFINYSESDANGEDLSDRDIQFLDVRGRYAAERFTWALRSSVRRDVTLAEVGFIRDPISGTTGSGTDIPSVTGDAAGPPRDDGTSTGTGEMPDPTDVVGGDPLIDGGIDTGSVEQQIRRYVIRANPSVEYRWSERVTTQLGYQHQSLDYDNGEEAGLEDSQANLVTVQVRREMTERDSARIVMAAARLEPDESSSSDSYQLTGGWARQFSQRSGGSFDAGVNYTDRDGEGDTGFVFRARGYRTTEVGNLYLQAERVLAPNGFGDLAETDRLILGMGTALSDTVEVSIGSSGYRTTGTSGNDREYFEIGPEIKWLFTPDFSVGATYAYQWADREDDPGGGASGNSVGIFLMYQPQREF